MPASSETCASVQWKRCILAAMNSTQFTCFNSTTATNTDSNLRLSAVEALHLGGDLYFCTRVICTFVLVKLCSYKSATCASVRWKRCILAAMSRPAPQMPAGRRPVVIHSRFMFATTRIAVVATALVLAPNSWCQYLYFCTSKASKSSLRVRMLDTLSPNSRLPAKRWMYSEGSIGSSLMTRSLQNLRKTLPSS